MPTVCFRTVEQTDEKNMMELEYFESHNENLHYILLGAKKLSVLSRSIEWSMKPLSDKSRPGISVYAKGTINKTILNLQVS